MPTMKTVLARTQRTKATKTGASRLNRSIILAVVAVLTCGASANGSTILTDPSAFSGNENTINFAGLCCSDSPGFTVSGVTFSPVGGNGSIQITSTNYALPRVGDQESTAIAYRFDIDDRDITDLLIEFDESVNRVGFEMILYGGVSMDVKMYMIGNDTVVDQVEFGSAQYSDWNFYGVETDTPFDRILVDVHRGGTYSISRWLFDNLKYESVSVVPVPAALPLFLSGLAGLGLIGWRNRRNPACRDVCRTQAPSRSCGPDRQSQSGA